MRIHELDSVAVMARRWPTGAAGIGRSLLLLALTLSVALVLGLPWGLVVRPGSARGVGQESVGTPTNPLPPSSEALASRSPWSRPESYPLTLRPRAPLYRPSAEWIGRLILPSPRETAAAPQEDWVWIEIEQAPAARQELIGRRLRLRWADRPELRRLVETVSTTIRLGEEARRAAAAANVIPVRLDGRRVGPLQSLAGARQRDDVTVSLDNVSLDNVSADNLAIDIVSAENVSLDNLSQNNASLEVDSLGSGARMPGGLRIASPPLQITGRWQALVSVVGRAAGEDLWRVRHFNPATARFDGAVEAIRIPALPPDRYGRRLIDPAGLLSSPHNSSGWLIQGAPAADGVFTVQALLPYRLLELAPTQLLRGTGPALANLRHDSWRSPLRRGTLRGTGLIPDAKTPPPWAVGERALLMHLFGGIGGAEGEPITGWTVTGHFAFGEAEVVRDGFTGQPRLALRYHQIYASNPNGIVSGSQDWSAYAGSLQRGWIGLRPFSDVLVPMGEQVLNAIDLQAELIAARYRSGDGSGVALVTPSTSCVQDSAQALWIAIQQLRREGTTEAMGEGDRERLRELGEAFDHLLEPFGRVRSDWKRNAASTLAVGTGSGRGATALGRHADHAFTASQRLRDALLSWRSLLPRSAHDLFAAEFLRVGLPLLVLRTDQIPGADPRLAPVAPTTLFGQLPGVGLLLGRLGDSVFPLWQPGGNLTAALISIGYGVIAWVMAGGGELAPRVWMRPLPLRRVPGALRLLVVPAFFEELVFRGLLLPSALDGVAPAALLAWMALSVGLFVLWHDLTARLASERGRAAGGDPRALARSALLGMACSLALVVSGSLWWPVLLHWISTMAWRTGAANARGR